MTHDRMPQSELRARTAYRKLHGSEEGFVPAPRKHRDNEESIMQRALVKWWQRNCARLGTPEILLMSIPNGGNGDAKRGSIMKAEGQRKGAPDLLLAKGRIWRPHPTNCTAARDYLGLFLELKTPTGRLSPEQEAFHQRLREQGYKVVVVRSLEEGIKEITDYLS
jgi:hypothetical protein